MCSQLARLHDRETSYRHVRPQYISRSRCYRSIGTIGLHYGAIISFQAWRIAANADALVLLQSEGIESSEYFQVIASEIINFKLPLTEFVFIGSKRRRPNYRIPRQTQLAQIVLPNLPRPHRRTHNISNPHRSKTKPPQQPTPRATSHRVPSQMR